MKILIVNDDGIYAKGLTTLAGTLAKHHDVTVIAPDGERSGSGRSLTFHGALNYQSLDIVQGAKCYTLSGTPSDCTKFGIDVIMQKNKPDVVISGINNTCNIGTDIVYSGTVNAALEACMHKVYGIAVSYDCKDGDYGFVAKFIAGNLEKLVDLLPEDKNTIFNINFPCAEDKLKGIRFARTGDRLYNDEYQYVEGRGYFITGYPVASEHNAHDTDVVLCEQNYATVAPVKINLNDETLYDRIKDIKL